VGKGSGRRPARVSDAEVSANWERTFSKGVRVKVYHFHKSLSVALYAASEEEAREELARRYPDDAEDFTLEDVQDEDARPTAADEDVRTYRDE